MRTIALEEHFLTADFLRAAQAAAPRAIAGIQPMHDKLLDLGAGRIAAIDEGGIDLQALSLAAIGTDALAAAEQTAVLRGVSDELAAAVAAHPTRFAAFCTPALKQPAAAAREIDRCLRLSGFVGVYVDGTCEGKFLDAPEFLPVLEAIEAHGAPLYIHPAPPPAPVFEAYYAGLPGISSMLLSIAGWGWHSETAIHVLRLILSGTLDRLPKLKIIIGHMGEGLPYALARTTSVFSRATHLKRSVAETIKDQVHITTSGFFTQPPFQCAADVVGLDHLMYSVDYPFSPNTHGQQFLHSLELTQPEFAALTHGNAEKLLKL
jgi:predicted TIM-barrel fold metal-dependent hydrolase